MKRIEFMGQSAGFGAAAAACIPHTLAGKFLPDIASSLVLGNKSATTHHDFFERFEKALRPQKAQE